MIGPCWDESKTLVCSSPRKSRHTGIWTLNLRCFCYLVSFLLALPTTDQSSPESLDPGKVTER